MSKPTILIVEDEAIIAADLASKLGKLSYEVIGTTARGEDAVEMACSLKPDIVLMDIRLKGSMDGIEAAEEIRRRHSAPVIYLICPFRFQNPGAGKTERAVRLHP